MILALFVPYMATLVVNMWRPDVAYKQNNTLLLKRRPRFKEIQRAVAITGAQGEYKKNGHIASELSIAAYQQTINDVS